jgi:hypothetical protein
MLHIRQSQLGLKKTYITQLELIAAVCAYITWPDILGHRLAHHFIDNRPARAGLIKGSSGKPDSARIINVMHVELMALQCQTWFGFVYSEDNLSDGPSRGDYALLGKGLLLVTGPYLYRVWCSLLLKSV